MGMAQKQGGDKDDTNGHFNTSPQATAMAGDFGTLDESPYLGFDLDGDDEDQFNLDDNGQLVGDYPGDVARFDSSDLHEKRKSIGDRKDTNDGGGKRRDSEGATGKKPGRKPLTAEPTTVSCLAGCRQCSLTLHRSAKLKTELPNEPSVIARKSISRIWKQKSKIWRRHPRPETMRMACSVLR